MFVRAFLRSAARCLPAFVLPVLSCLCLQPTLLASGQTAPVGTVQAYSFEHPAMGTTYTLLLYAANADAASREAAGAFALVDDVEALLSNYQPGSELSRINQSAYKGPVTTDPETLDFLERSLSWSAASGGAFDISVGALMKAWGFFRSSGHVPTPGELAAVQVATGWQKIELAPATRSIRFRAPGIELDPGGIGKGYAVDKVVALLRRDGVQAALLSAGSSTIYALGRPPGKTGWLVRVPDPSGSGPAASSVLLRDTSLSTASCAEKHFVLAGHLYCHIMDPRLLRPVEGRLQATVIAPSATDSDALSNVMFVEDGTARAASMRALGPGDAALVFSGTPAPDPGDGGRQRMLNQIVACQGYRWPGGLPQRCSAEAQTPGQRTQHAKETQ